MRFIADERDVGVRLDQAIARHFPDISRRRAKDLIGIGGVFVNRTRIKQSSRVLAHGDKVELHLGSAEGTVTRGAAHQAALPELDIAFEDEHLIVVNKPARMITAPTPESDRGNLLWFLGARQRQQQAASQTGEVNARTAAQGTRIFLVHRLDMGTSGLLVFAKTDAANRALADRFSDHDIERQYEALALGHSARGDFTVESPIEGRAARTHAEVIARVGEATHFRLTLFTGRTHQIRIHLAREGLPVLGDKKYGSPAALAFLPRAPRLMLHAAVLGFVHPATGEALRLVCPPPDDFASYARELAAAAGSLTA